MTTTLFNPGDAQTGANMIADRCHRGYRQIVVPRLCGQRALLLVTCVKAPPEFLGLVRKLGRRDGVCWACVRDSLGSCGNAGTGGGDK